MAHVQGLVTARENEYNIVLHSSEKAADTGKGKAVEQNLSLQFFYVGIIIIAHNPFNSTPQPLICFLFGTEQVCLGFLE